MTAPKSRRAPGPRRAGAAAARPTAADAAYAEWTAHVDRCRPCSAPGGLCSRGAELRAAWREVRR